MHLVVSCHMSFLFRVVSLVVSYCDHIGLCVFPCRVHFSKISHDTRYTNHDESQIHLLDPVVSKSVL